MRLILHHVKKLRKNSFLRYPRHAQAVVGKVQTMTWNYTDEVAVVSSELWGAMNEPVAIYQRGSSASGGSNYKPWDIDLYVVGKNAEADEVDTVVEELAARYPQLPELDVTVLDESVILEGNLDVLKHLLLFHDGKLINGRCLKSKMKIIPLDIGTAKSVKYQMNGFIDSRMSTLRDYRKGQNSDAEAIQFHIKKAAKMLVRAGCYFGIAHHGEFTRKLPKCLLRLKKQFPEMEKDLDYLYLSLGQPVVQPSSFLEVATRVYTTLYHEHSFGL